MDRWVFGGSAEMSSVCLVNSVMQNSHIALVHPSLCSYLVLLCDCRL